MSEEYWTTRAGKRIFYSELSDIDLQSILNWIVNRAQKGILVNEAYTRMQPWDWDDVIECKGLEILNHYDYLGLLKEAEKRKLDFCLTMNDLIKILL